MRERESAKNQGETKRDGERKWKFSMLRINLILMEKKTLHELISKLRYSSYIDFVLKSQLSSVYYSTSPVLILVPIKIPFI